MGGLFFACLVSSWSTTTATKVLSKGILVSDHFFSPRVFLQISSTMSDLDNDDKFSEVSSIGSNLEDPGLDYYQVSAEMCRAIYVVAGGSEGICNRTPPCRRHHHRDPSTTRGPPGVYPVIRGARGGVKGILAERVEPADLVRMVEETRVANQALLCMQQGLGLDPTGGEDVGNEDSDPPIVVETVADNYEESPMPAWMANRATTRGPALGTSTPLAAQDAPAAGTNPRADTVPPTGPATSIFMAKMLASLTSLGVSLQANGVPAGNLGLDNTAVAALIQLAAAQRGTMPKSVHASSPAISAPSPVESPEMSSLAKSMKLLAQTMEGGLASLGRHLEPPRTNKCSSTSPRSPALVDDEIEVIKSPQTPTP
jgi:hypothetical protein